MINIEIDQIKKEEWSELLCCFKDASIYQSWSYGAIRWGENNLSHLLLKIDSEVVAICQVRIVKVPVLGSGIANIKWGPLWLCRNKQRKPMIFKTMVQELIKEYAVKRGLLLRIVPNQAAIDANEMNFILLEEGFTLNHSEETYNTLVLNLSPSLEDLKKGLKKKWRQNLRHAEDSALDIIEGENDDLFDVVTHLYKEMHSRKGFEDTLNLNDLRAIQNDLKATHKMKIMVCEQKGEPIAARVVSSIGEVAVDMIAASGSKGLNTYSSYLLLWRIVEWLKSIDCMWYDLGGIDPVKNPGGYQFKSGLAGSNGMQVSFSEFTLSRSAKSSFLVGLGRHVMGFSQKSTQLIERLSKRR